MRLEAEAGGCTSRREGPGRPGRRTHTAFSILRHDSSATCGYTRVSGLGCGRATRERRLPASRREGLQRGWSWKLRFRVCTNASPAPHGRAASVTGPRSGQASTCADHCPLHSRAAQCVCEENAHPVPTCHKSCHHTRSSRRKAGPCIFTHWRSARPLCGAASARPFTHVQDVVGPRHRHRGGAGARSRSRLDVAAQPGAAHVTAVPPWSARSCGNIGNMREMARRRGRCVKKTCARAKQRGGRSTAEYKKASHDCARNTQPKKTFVEVPKHAAPGPSGVSI